MCYEIEKSWKKIREHSKLPLDKLDFVYRLILSNLVFINEEMIPSEIWLEVEDITKGIDIQDSDFVALTMYLNATLWTGDKFLYNGLRKKNFKNVINTTELLALWNR